MVFPRLHRTFTPRRLAFLALVALLPHSAASAGTVRPSPAAACAAHDLHAVTLIEDHGLFEDTDPEVLHEAALQVSKARQACRAGDLGRALALYEGIALEHVRTSSFHRILLR